MNRATPFATASLEVIALQQKHVDVRRTASEAELRQLENAFEEGVRRLRPLYTATATLEVARFYTTRLHSALLYFGMHDDPLTRQLEVVSGDLKRYREAALKQQGATGADVASRREAFDSVRVDRLVDANSALTADELPAPDIDRLIQDLGGDAAKIPSKHRGHWILQDPEIAITKKGRKMDPW